MSRNGKVFAQAHSDFRSQAKLDSDAINSKAMETYHPKRQSRNQKFVFGNRFSVIGFTEHRSLKGATRRLSDHEVNAEPITVRLRNKVLANTRKAFVSNT